MVDKTNVKFLSGNLSDIDNATKRAGQILFATDTDENGYIYFDVSQDLRLKMGAKADYAINDVNASPIVSTYFSTFDITRTGAQISLTFSTPDNTAMIKNLSGATTSYAGLVTNNSQSWKGLKTLYGNSVSYKPSANSSSSTYKYDVQLKLVGDTYNSSSATSPTEKYSYVLLSGYGTTFRITGMEGHATSVTSDSTHWTPHDLTFNLSSQTFGNSNWTFSGKSSRATKADLADTATSDASNNVFTSTYLSEVLLTKAGDKNTLTFSTPDNTESAIDLIGASTLEAGLVTTENQDWTGLKGFYRSSYNFYKEPNSTSLITNNANIRLYGDTLTATSPTKNYIDLISVGVQQKFILESFVFSEDDTEHGYYTTTKFEFDFKNKKFGGPYVNDIWTFKGNAETATHALLADEASAVDWGNVTNRPLNSIVSSVSLDNLTGNLTISTLDNTEITNGAINIAPLTEAGGTIPLDFIPLLSLDKIPQGALDRLIKVEDEEALLALTTDTVQLGDSVLVTDSKVMYIVIDESKLGTKNACQEYKADTALRAFADEDGKNIKASYLSSVSGAHSQTGGYNLTFLNGQSDASIVTIPMASNTNNGLMSKEDKQKMDDFGPVIEYEKTFYATDFADPTVHDWIDTGIEGDSHLETGTYIVQIYNNGTTASGFYQEYWSGIMSWYSGTTNSVSHNSDEIYLHNCGYADTSSGKDLYLRTIRSATGDEKTVVRLQIAYGGETFPTSLNVKFNFRKMI